MSQEETDSMLAEKYRRRLANNKAAVQRSREKLKATGKFLLQIWVTDRQAATIKDFLENGA